ncbi:MAG: polysaccharide lyase, partial [Terriglobales bacterium]
VENTAGVWHEVVVRMKMNAVGQHDGLQELWVDGRKISQTGMRWRDTTDLRLNQFAVQMYVEQAVQVQFLWVDDVVVWTPGP